MQDLDLSTELMSTMKVMVCLKTAEKDSATSQQHGPELVQEFQNGVDEFSAG